MNFSKSQKVKQFVEQAERQMDAEDRRVLQSAGAMGHQFVGVYGQLGKRKVRSECNDAPRAFASFEADDEYPRVYKHASASVLRDGVFVNESHWVQVKR